MCVCEKGRQTGRHGGVMKSVFGQTDHFLHLAADYRVVIVARWFARVDVIRLLFICAQRHDIIRLKYRAASNGVAIKRDCLYINSAFHECLVNIV